jgi:hypothetical protein
MTGMSMSSMALQGMVLGIQIVRAERSFASNAIVRHARERDGVVGS